ncbi:recombinase RecT [Robertmurraya korlensis]|uniref:RecT family recombinase n=1 Tax=Robertmurraya korlensis TaxID=519977 RepID=UPI00203FB798|nr:RecT family recombinase [Robertmurraya korlensis]MCM3599365.1 recombinase RecT [Robertmurraya korlensis]
MSKNLPSTLPLTPAITEAFAPQVLEVIRTSIAPTANDQEFLLFAHKAASYGLDPFKNEIFFIKYGSTARIQFAAEAYLSKAREKEGFQPPDTQMVHENDEFKIRMNPETKEMEVVLHEIGFPRGKIIGAYSIAYRDGYKPVTVIMDIEEIDHMFKGQNKDNWIKWTADMFGKHVQQRALKKQYGLEFDDETITTGEAESNIPEYKPQERRDITPEQEVIDAPQKPKTEEDPVKKLRTEITKKLKKLGVNGKEAVSDYINMHAPNMGEHPSLAELTGLLDIIDMDLDMKQMQESNGDELV